MLPFAKTNESKIETELVVCNVHDDLSLSYFMLFFFFSLMPF